MEDFAEQKCEDMNVVLEHLLVLKLFSKSEIK